MHLTGSLPAGNEGRGVFVHNRRIFFSDGDLGMKEIALDASHKPRVLANYDRERLLTDIGINNEFVYATNTRSGLQVCKYIQHGDCTHQDNLAGLDYASAIALNDNIAAVVDQTGLKIISLENPENPRILSSVVTPGRASGVCLYKTFALVADWFSGLHIFDLSIPESPEWISGTEMDGWAIDVQATQERAYVCCVNGGLMIVDIREPSAPKLLSTDTTCTAPEGLALKDNFLYLADFNSGLLIFKIDNPSRPEPYKWFQLNVCKGVQVNDDTLLLANYIFGLKIFDLSNPGNPVMIGEVDTPGKAYESAFIPGCKREAFVADWHGLVHVSW